MDGEARVELEHDFLDNAKAFKWDAVRTMLRETPDLINVQPCGRWTALHQAAFEGNAGVVQELIDLGADVKAHSRARQTPAGVAKGGAKEVLAAAARAGGAADEAAPRGLHAAAPAEEAPPAATVADEAAPPPAKKAKKDPVYRMNINNAVDREYESCSLNEIASSPTSALQGIADRGRDILKKFGVKTIRGLGRWKFYRMAKGISGLSSLEAPGGRWEGTALNMNGALDKKHEGKELREIAELPPSALQGLAGWVDEELAKLNIKTIADLGSWKFAQWAEWITDLAEFEEEDAC